MYVCVCACARACVRAYVSACMHTCIRRYVRMYVRMYACMYVSANEKAGQSWQKSGKARQRTICVGVCIIFYRQPYVSIIESSSVGPYWRV